MRRAAEISGLAAAAACLVLLLAGAAGAQSSTISCGSFSTQQQAQAFYDQHEHDNPSNPDPYHLDADGDGKACEGLPSAAAAVPTAAPISTKAPLPNNGAETGVMAMSGISLLEAGYGMTLLARRYGVKRRSVPIYLLRKLVSAGRSGNATVALGNDIYLVHGSALTATSEDLFHYIDLSDEDVAMFGMEEEQDDPLFAPLRAERPRVSVYAALAQGARIAGDPHDATADSVDVRGAWGDDGFARRV
jgi:hypothetical protein